MESRLLIVTGISDEKTDKNGMPYVTVSVSQPSRKRITDEATGESYIVKTKARSTAFNAWKHSYLEVAGIAKDLGKEIEALKPNEYADAKPDFAYTLEEGDRVEGDIITREVEPYSIVNEETGEEREVDTYSCAVLGNTSDASFKNLIKQTFNRNGHEVLEGAVDDAVIATKTRENVFQD